MSPRKNDEAIYEPEGVDPITPKDFDLEQWLSGLAPARAHYPLAGVTVVLEARTTAWFQQFREDTEGQDAEETDLQLLAAHITSPELGADELRVIKRTHAPEIAEMLNLVVSLDMKPRNQLQPRFLPESSD